MNHDLAQLVHDRAGGVCEYCQMPQSARRLAFQIEHVIAKQHGGPTTSENLALACGHCNRHKGPNIAGIDPQTGTLIRLFHPRLDVWANHFAARGGSIVGLTEIGRATVHVLNMNDPLEVAVREELLPRRE
jgi:hypothetical protein